ncbi:MAG: hypothetical protein JWO42_1902, partial [Chloroflexi bacterium]|nr:hypothetical protein [Chloroflexota bacterium]
CPQAEVPTADDYGVIGGHTILPIML